MESFAQFVLSIFVFVTIILNFCQKQTLSYRLLIDIKTRVTRFEPKVGHIDGPEWDKTFPSQNVLNLICKHSGIVPFGTNNLTFFGPQFDIHDESLEQANTLKNDWNKPTWNCVVVSSKTPSGILPVAELDAESLGSSVNVTSPVSNPSGSTSWS